MCTSCTVAALVFGKATSDYKKIYAEYINGNMVDYSEIDNAYSNYKKVVLKYGKVISVCME